MNGKQLSYCYFMFVWAEYLKLSKAEIARHRTGIRNRGFPLYQGSDMQKHFEL